MTRRLKDAYYTPAALGKVLLAHIPLPKTVFEPCAGDGALASIFPASCQIITNDIDIAKNTDYHANACYFDIWRKVIYNHKPDWCITNPPFSSAEFILANALYSEIPNVAMLLRLSFLEPTKGRAPLLDKFRHCISDIIVVGQPRPSFTGKGTDSVTTCWIVWERFNMAIQNTRMHFITNWSRQYEQDTT